MDNGERINKYISECGYCSRRKADELIADEKVFIDGKLAVMGDRVFSGQKVTINGKALVKEEKKVWIMLNKPEGLECTARRDVENVIDYIKCDEKVFYVGRLDKDSEGLLLLTNDGYNSNRIQKARFHHEKEYIVKVDKDITEDFLKGMAGGVPILDTVTRKCKVEKVGTRTFRIILTQGLNRQIRNMCRYFDYHVRYLKRVRVMNIKLGGLRVGQWRYLTDQEVKELINMLDEG